MQKIHINYNEQLFDKIKHELENLCDSNYKVSCIKLFHLAKKFNIEPKFLGAVATENGIRIKDCQLGQFGNLPVDNKYDRSIYFEILRLSKGEKQIDCRLMFKLASKYGLRKLRSVVKNSDIEVINCQLGCFRLKTRPRLTVKTKIWIENKTVGMVLGKGKIEILKLIEEKGSIADAAKKIGVSYKKVWDHIQILQRNMNKQYVIAEKGRGKGSYITRDAKELIEKFEILSKEVEEFADRRFRELFYPDRKYRKFREGKSNEEN